MVVNWEKILTRAGVEWVDVGPNVKRGNINIKCPFCVDDPSHHMGLNSYGQWACWRNSQHRGRNPAVLVAKVLRITLAKAYEVLGIQKDSFDGGDLGEAAKWLGASPTAPKVKNLTMPEDFLPLWKESYSSKRFIEYLEGRGFDKPVLAARYLHLYYAVSGDQSYRVLFPYFEDGELVHWTGRTIYKDGMPRYRALSKDESVNPHALYGHDHCTGGKVLLIQEGPIDAAKALYYGDDYGLHSIAVSTSTLHREQMSALVPLTSKYQSIIIMLDRGELLKSSLLVGALTHRKVLISEPPMGSKDFGALSPDQADRACRDLCRGVLYE